MNITKIETFTEEEFHTMYKLKRNHIDKNACFDGCMYETYGEELAYVFKLSKKNRVVTIIEGDDEEKEITFINAMGVSLNEIITISNFYYLSGFHYVNRYGYLILNKPYLNEFEVKVD